MQTSTLISLIKKDEKISPYFRGCVSVNNFIDESYLYKDPNSANFWIVYTAPTPAFPSSNSNLGHFFFFGCKTVMISAQGEKILPESGSWYCDSYALKPAYYSSRLSAALVNLSTYGSYQSVPFQLQNNNSNVCALYSMLFAEKFCSKPTAATTLSDFIAANFLPDNTVENDTRVLSFYQNKLRVPKRKLDCVGANFCTSLDKFMNTPRATSIE